jgi:hypothetical protein
VARAKNLQVLTEEIKRKYPGVVIYGIGDAAHQDGLSDHNEDDMPAKNAAQSDADTNPEHRAIDVMLGPYFTKANAEQLVLSLVRDPAARARLFYIIWDGRIWSRSYGWVARQHSGDPHRDHPHISGWAADDENPSGWPAVGNTSQEVNMGALEENVVIGTDIASLSGNYVKAGQKIPLGRFIQLIFSHNERDFQTGLANKATLAAVVAEVHKLHTEVAAVKELLLKGDGDPDFATFVNKIEEEANKTRLFAEELIKKDKAAENKREKLIGEAWLASVVE